MFAKKFKRSLDFARDGIIFVYIFFVFGNYFLKNKILNTNTNIKIRTLAKR
ncbi:hypothetical protein HMPREF3224_01805 [Anaerococcus hydrogenalis]|nr:hypothetical protein HMPREF3224_01805 [Anaerococcus hydrogenalis]